MIFKEIIIANSLNSLDINQLEYYLNHISNLGLVTLNSGNEASNLDSNDFAYIIEIINCHSELCYYLVERWLKVPIFDDHNDDAYKIKEEENFNEVFLFQATPLFQQITELLEKVLNIDVSNSGVKLISLSENRNLDQTLNTSKKNAIETLNLLFSYIIQTKTQHGHKFHEQQKSIINDFIQRFEEHLKFFLTQLHQVIVGIYNSDFLLSNQVLFTFFSLFINLAI